MNIQYATTLIRAWIGRREAKGFAVCADDVWARIRTNWPTAAEDDREAVFQACGR